MHGNMLLKNCTPGLQDFGYINRDFSIKIERFGGKDITEGNDPMYRMA
jgi:hypothetical protein